MPSLKDTKRRIGSVKNTQKITHAMKLVSAAKFARANQAALAARPYSNGFEKLVSKLAKAALDQGVSNDLFGKSITTKKELVILIATDRGLCGSLNSSIFKMVTRFRSEKKAAGIELDFVCWGRRAVSFGKKFGVKSLEDKEKVTDKPKYEAAVGHAQNILGFYRDAGYDTVHVAFVEFKSAISQIPRVKQLLPIVPDAAAEKTTGGDAIIEPDLQTLMDSLLSRYISVAIFRCLLESYASEQGARMSAMENASKNAKEVIRKLTLQYNRARQAAITKELIEITSGAQAL